MVVKTCSLTDLYTETRREFGPRRKRHAGLVLDFGET